MNRARIAGLVLVAISLLLGAAACGEQRLSVKATCSKVVGEPGVAWTLTIENSGTGDAHNIEIEIDDKVVNRISLETKGGQDTHTQGPILVPPNQKRWVKVAQSGVLLYDEHWSGNTCTSPMLSSPVPTNT